MRPAGRIDAYRPVIEPIEDLLYGSDGKQVGDPRKAAEVIIAAVESPQPPLLLGADAISVWEGKRDTMDAELATWRETSEDTAYDDAVASPIPSP